MIHVIKKYDEQHILRILEISGHAQYSAKGSDIVCSAVSSLILCNLMYVEKHEIGVMRATEESGYLYVEVIEMTDALALIMDIVVEGLDMICQQYPKYIKIETHGGESNVIF